MRASPRSFRRFVVLGGGKMGSQVALLLAARGYYVTIVDANAAGLMGLEAKYRGWIASDLPDAAAQTQALSRITYLGGEYDSPGDVQTALAQADGVFETLPEDLALKTKVLTYLDGVCRPDALLASVSSSQPVSRMSGGVERRDRVCNIHFFMLYPIRLQAAEVAGCPETAPETIADVHRLLESLEIIPFDVAEESLGFIFNFVWYQIKAAMLYLCDKGVATPQLADRLFRIVLGTQYGPCLLMQMVGLPTVRDIARLYAAEGGPGAFPVPELLNRMIAGGEQFYPDPRVNTVPGWLETGRLGATDDAPFLLRESFAGCWKLVSMELQDGTGTVIDKPMGDAPRGTLFYTRAGDVSVHIMHTTQPNIAVFDPLRYSDEQAAAAFRAGVSYSGVYRLDGHNVVHTVVDSSVPSLIGAPMIRGWEFDAHGQLVLSTPPGQFGGTGNVLRLTWKLSHRL